MLRKKKDIDLHVKSISENEIGKHDFRIGLLYLNVGAFKEAKKYLGRCINENINAKRAFDFCNKQLKIDDLHVSFKINQFLQLKIVLQKIHFVFVIAQFHRCE